MCFMSRGAEAWKVLTVKGVREGEAKGKFGRVWESRREPLAEEGYIEREGS